MRLFESSAAAFGRCLLAGLSEDALLSAPLSSSLLMAGVGVCDLRLTSLLTRSFGSSLRTGVGFRRMTGEELAGEAKGLGDGEALLGTFIMTFLMTGGGALFRPASPKKFMLTSPAPAWRLAADGLEPEAEK